MKDVKSTSEYEIITQRSESCANQIYGVRYSVLMSVYAKETPENLMSSIKSMIDQTIQPSDFVIVCDGPLGSALNEILENYEKLYPELFQIIKISQNVGLGNALKKGIMYCRYDTVARMDSDDVAFADRCERQLTVMKKYQVQMVSGTILEFDQDMSRILASRVVPESDEEIRKCAKRRNPFNHNCMMYSKKAVENAGNYIHCPGFEDYFLWVRMLQNGSRGWNIQEPILYARTGASMYQRRGGFQYMKSMLEFKWKLKKSGFFTLKDFAVSAGGHAIVCMMPNKMRSIIYEKVLRKN